MTLKKIILDSRAKLTEKQVLEILASDELQSILAERYGVSNAQVSRIKAGKLWKHLSAGKEIKRVDHRYKLTEKQVLEILDSDELHRITAKKYGVSRQVISDIKAGKKWKHLKGVD